MKGAFILDDPSAMEATMTVTMTLRDWEMLRSKISDASYHRVAAQFEALISDLVGKASESFQAEVEAK